MEESLCNPSSLASCVLNGSLLHCSVVHIGTYCLRSNTGTSKGAMLALPFVYRQSTFPSVTAVVEAPV